MAVRWSAIARRSRSSAYKSRAVTFHSIRSKAKSAYAKSPESRCHTARALDGNFLPPNSLNPETGVDHRVRIGLRPADVSGAA